MLNIADKIIVGLTTPKTANKLPESMIAPIGKSSGEKNKMANIRTRYKNNVQELDNIPLPGFTLVSSGRRTWGSSETIWNIIDPRGFTSIITSSNLENILHCTGITEGLIQEKCVWAREDSRISMVLLPVSSEDYIEAVNNTTALANKVSKKDISLGDVVKLQNGLTGTYFGVVNMYDSHVANGRDRYITPGLITKKQIIQVTPTSYYCQTDLKILSIVKKAAVPFTKDETLLHLNSACASGNVFSSNVTSATNPSANIYSIYKKRYMTHKPVAPASIIYSKVSISYDEAVLLFTQGGLHNDIGMLLLVNDAGDNFLIHHETRWSNSKATPVTINSFPTIQINANSSNLELHHSIYHMHKTRYSDSNKFSDARSRLDEYVAFYKIVKHINNETYI